MGFFDKITRAFGSINSGNHGKGPIVKTGPTAGKVRSRNLDGRWRAKRSDAGILRGPKK